VLGFGWKPQAKMSASPKLINHRKWIIACLALLVVGLIIGFAWQTLSRMIALIGDQAAVSTVVRSYGFWGPLVIILLHTLQIVIAAIPGHLIMIASGYIYGFWGGLILTLITTVVLSQAAFSLARWAGRPVVERLVPADSIQQWDRLANHYGVFFFMISFMLPVFPADVMNYVAGLSSLSWLKFLVANFFGRLPGVVVMTLIGSHGLALSPQVWFIFVVGGLILLYMAKLVLKKIEMTVPSA
jgi:uncharacterized membrane protein YdjX (TVP38/TMEM64 family)